MKLVSSKAVLALALFLVLGAGTTVAFSRGWVNLSEEQRDALTERRAELVESGLDKEQIVQEIQELRGELGIGCGNCPDCDGEEECHKRSRKRFCADSDDCLKQRHGLRERQRGFEFN